jgi:hypothetical protein
MGLVAHPKARVFQHAGFLIMSLPNLGVWLFRNNPKTIKLLLRNNSWLNMGDSPLIASNPNQVANTDEQLASVFEQADAPVVSAPEVATALDISQQAAHSRLQEAVEDGWVNRKKIGAAAVAWWMSSKTGDYPSTSE